MFWNLIWLKQLVFMEICRIFIIRKKDGDILLNKLMIKNGLTYAKHIASLFITAITQHLCWLWAILIHQWVKLCSKVSAYMALLISKAFRKHKHLSFTTTTDLFKLLIGWMTNQIKVITALVITEREREKKTTNKNHPFGFTEMKCLLSVKPKSISMFKAALWSILQYT